MKTLKVIGIVFSILLTGCSTNTTTNTTVLEPEKQEIQAIPLRVWGGQHDQELLAQMIESFKEEYKDQAEFDITIEAVNEGECKYTILENINNAPDVFAFADDQFLELAASGILEPISSADTIRNENIEGSVQAASIDNQLYAYPLTSDNGYFMFYNKNYFKESDITSLDNMLDIAAENNKQLTFDLGNAWYFYSFFGNTGLTMKLNEDGLTNHCNWNSTAHTIKGIDVGNALLNIASHPGFLSGGDQVLNDGAANGSVIAGVSGIWLASVLQELWGDDFGATKLPTYKCADKDIQMSSYAGYKLLGSNAYSPHKEWADKLAMWLSNRQNQLLRFQVRGNGPSNKEIAMSKDVQNTPQIKALIMQSEFASLQRVGAKYWQPTGDFAGMIIRGELSPITMQSALDEMVKNIQSEVTD